MATNMANKRQLRRSRWKILYDERKSANEKNVKAYVKHFLARHELASAAMARFGQQAWNSAIDAAIEIVRYEDPRLETIPRRIRALKR